MILIYTYDDQGQRLLKYECKDNSEMVKDMLTLIQLGEDFDVRYNSEE